MTTRTKGDLRPVPLTSVLSRLVIAVNCTGDLVAKRGASAGCTVMLVWALLASGQITMRKADGWQAPQRCPTSPCLH